MTCRGCETHRIIHLPDQESQVTFSEKQGAQTFRQGMDCVDEFNEVAALGTEGRVALLRIANEVKGEFEECSRHMQTPCEQGRPVGAIALFVRILRALSWADIELNPLGRRFASVGVHASACFQIVRNILKRELHPISTNFLIHANDRPEQAE